MVMTSSPASLASTPFSTGVSGVAALDSPQLTQTKLEIRSIVSEIAELSASDRALDDYTNAVLPLICNAMGATAAAIWSINADSQIERVADYHWPEGLRSQAADSNATIAAASTVTDSTATDSTAADSTVTDATAASQHLVILACVASDGSPILVPPKSVRITANRPTNPLDDALLVVPIKIRDRCDMLLEVVQPASGGPAAQRGYLRFVAQMADLVAEYFRRRQLRTFALQADYVERLQRGLIAIGRSETAQLRLHQVASTMANLLAADLVILLARRKRRWPTSSRWQVRSISDVPAFDARSEIVSAAQQSLTDLPLLNNSAMAQLAIVSSCDIESHDRPNSDASPEASSRAARLRELLGCAHLLQLSLCSDGSCQALLALDARTDLNLVRSRAVELADTMGMFIAPSVGDASPLRPVNATSISNPDGALKRSFAYRIERAIVRTSTVLLALAITLFPTPDHVASVAILEAIDKELYYAPSGATVDKVWVANQEVVAVGTKLVTLEDSQLSSRLIELDGKLSTTVLQLDELHRRILLGSPSSNVNVDAIVSQIKQLEADSEAMTRELGIRNDQLKKLTIKAQRDGIVSTWDAQNRMEGRPVAPGQLLISTCAPNSAWQLRLSIPERQAGRVQDALKNSPRGLPVQFSLSSHPSEVRTGRLTSLSKQLVKDADGTSKVVALVAVDSRSLPSKTDGAVARASIDCGRTIAGWLVVRDAYREASAWWRLNF